MCTIIISGLIRSGREAHISSMIAVLLRLVPWHDGLTGCNKGKGRHPEWWRPCQILCPLIVCVMRRRRSDDDISMVLGTRRSTQFNSLYGTLAFAFSILLADKAFHIPEYTQGEGGRAASRAGSRFHQKLWDLSSGVSRRSKLWICRDDE